MKTRKTYPIEKSPLYAQASRRKLAALLGTNSKQLNHLEKSPQYAVFLKDGRAIQEPKGLQRWVHDRVQSLLVRVEVPTYVYSGKRGSCYVDNARAHIANSHLMAVDIKGFYSNTKKEYVFRFFRYLLKMPEDIAHLMSGVCCYQGRIPTGSPLSQSLAYWAYCEMFGRMERLAAKNDMAFSLYVDDMTFSRNSPIPRSFHLNVDAILKEHGLWLKKEKTEYRGQRQYKRVTGCFISPDHRLLVANEKRASIVKLASSFSASNSKWSLSDYQTAVGAIGSARQVEPGIFNSLLRGIRAKYRTQS